MGKKLCGVEYGVFSSSMSSLASKLDATALEAGHGAWRIRLRGQNIGDFIGGMLAG